MEEKPLLQFYTDETWGYDIWDEESKKKEGISVKFQQEENETREDFFKRLGIEPEPNMYGSDLGMDKKARDRFWAVREAVALQGYGLDILVYDEDYQIRRAVALQGYGLDILVHDKRGSVRTAVVRQGYGLDVLVHDKNKWVRYEVAQKGFGLDVLINDEDQFVLFEVEKYLDKHDYPSIEAWIRDNPKKVADRKNLNKLD